jgi:uncharacterized protein (TIGR02598 family)
MYDINTLTIPHSPMTTDTNFSASFRCLGKAGSVSTAARAGTGAFSLIEVVLAIGVVAFAFVALLGVLPVGLSTFRKAMDTSLGAEIGQRVINDLQESDFDSVMTEAKIDLTLPQTAQHGQLPHRFFDDQGNEVILPNSNSGTTADPLASDRATYHILYDVHTQIICTPQIPGLGGRVQSPSLANVIVQVANNPAGLSLTPDQLDNTSKIPYFTYSGFISRNGKTLSTNSGS